MLVTIHLTNREYADCPYYCHLYIEEYVAVAERSIHEILKADLLAVFLKVILENLSELILVIQPV